MHIPKIPFHNVLCDLLFTLFFKGECLKSVTKDLSNEQTVRLEIPLGAQYAIIQLEVDPLQNLNRTKAMRYIIAQNFDSIEDGLLVGDLEKIEIMGVENMSRFYAVTVDQDMQHKLRVQYFG